MKGLIEILSSPVGFTGFLAYLITDDMVISMIVMIVSVPIFYLLFYLMEKKDELDEDDDE